MAVSANRSGFSLIEALVDAIRARFDATVTEDAGERETVTFKLPRLLTA